MSAYIVEDETINRIVAYLVRDDFSSNPTARYLLNQAGFDVSRDARGLAHEMHRLNVYGVDERYGEGQGREMSGEPFTYVDMGAPTIYQALMSLQCLIYQCSEGDCVERPLYKLLRDIEINLMHAIIDTIPQYKAAQWG